MLESMLDFIWVYVAFVAILGQKQYPQNLV